MLPLLDNENDKSRKSPTYYIVTLLTSLVQSSKFVKKTGDKNTENIRAYCFDEAPSS